MIKCEQCGKTITRVQDELKPKTWLAVSYLPYEEKPTYMFCCLKCLKEWIRTKEQAVHKLKKDMEKVKE
jgi:endogenous inhibitor of DNA gyrase (YacG/DUF329 family)